MISPELALRGLEQTATQSPQALGEPGSSVLLSTSTHIGDGADSAPPGAGVSPEIAVWAWPAILGKYVEERGYSKDQWDSFNPEESGVLAPGFLQRFFGDRLADKLKGKKTVSLVPRGAGERFDRFVGDRYERAEALEAISEDIVDLLSAAVLSGEGKLNFLESTFLLSRRVMYRHVLPNGNGRFAILIRNALLIAFGYRPARLGDMMSHYRGFFDTAVVSDEETVGYIESYFPRGKVEENRVALRKREIARVFSFNREETTGQVWLSETLDLLKSPAATIAGPFSLPVDADADASVFEWKSPEAVKRMISVREPEKHAQSSTDGEGGNILVLRVGAFTPKKLSHLLLPRSNELSGADEAETRVRALLKESAETRRVRALIKEWAETRVQALITELRRTRNMLVGESPWSSRSFLVKEISEIEGKIQERAIAARFACFSGLIHSMLISHSISSLSHQLYLIQAVSPTATSRRTTAHNPATAIVQNINLLSIETRK